MARLSVSRQAKRDLAEIFLFIARDSIDAAGRMRGRLQECGQTIAKQPNIGREREEYGPGVRSLAAGNYVIFYKQARTVSIIRVLHGARDSRNLLT